LINLKTKLYNGLTNEKIITFKFFYIGISCCASTPEQLQNVAQETIRYSSSPCFGACPIYSVEVSPNGTVNFEGKQYTKVTGTRDLQVDPAVYKKLQSELKTYRPETGSNVKQQVVCKLQQINLVLILLETSRWYYNTFESLHWLYFTCKYRIKQIN
jgi:hypothetical protein